MSDLCRTCGEHHKHINILNLFEGTSKSRTKLTLLNIITGLNLKKDKKLPDYICADCQISLEDAVKFRSTCHRVQLKLLELDISKGERDHRPFNVDNPEDIDLRLEDFAISCLDDLTFPIQENNWSKEVDKFLGDNQIENPKTSEITALPNELSYAKEISLNKSKKCINIKKYCLKPTVIPKQMQVVVNTCKSNLKGNSMLLNVINDKDKYPKRKGQHIMGNLPKSNNVKKYIKFICDICGQSFNYKVYFDAHINRHLGLNPYECNLCSQKFNGEPNLKRHMLKHFGTLPYACHYCERRFLDSYLRTRHERMHKNDRPFKCSFCEKGFTSNYILKHHLLTHTKEKPFSCNICQRTFKSKAALVQHYKSSVHLQNLNKNCAA